MNYAELKAYKRDCLLGALSALLMLVDEYAFPDSWA